MYIFVIVSLPAEGAEASFVALLPAVDAVVVVDGLRLVVKDFDLEKENTRKGRRFDSTRDAHFNTNYG